MNAVLPINEQLKVQGNKPALVFPGKAPISFKELGELTSRVQTALVKRGLQPGQSVLLAIELSPLLYAAILACARHGLSVGLVEPWMPLSRIEQTIALMQPKAFLAGSLGQLWGIRVAGIRQIPNWLTTREVLSSPALESNCENVDREQPCIITFTSGSTGVPKGVVRSHSYLKRQQKVVSAALKTAELGPDLVVFANMALENLGHGRSSILMPSRWPDSAFRAIENLPTTLQPESFVGGPAFLKKALLQLSLPKLKSFFVGGALADCALFEAALSRWPESLATHVYGSTEAEPVAMSPMSLAVHESRNQGFFQVVYCGQPTPGMQFQQLAEQTWIAGDHVCPEYLGDQESNRQNKRRDDSGTLWHRMGDRIKIKAGAWWYHGREQQSLQNFLDEQRLYNAIQNSEAMIDQGSSGERIVYCTRAKEFKLIIKALWPDVSQIKEAKIYRDRRHRARIDREATRRGHA